MLHTGCDKTIVLCIGILEASYVLHLLKAALRRKPIPRLSMQNRNERRSIAIRVWVRAGFRVYGLLYYALNTSHNLSAQ
jgi:hypothetical protein